MMVRGLASPATMGCVVRGRFEARRLLPLALLVAGCGADLTCASVAFAARVVANSADGAYSVFAIDVDGDGDVDALSASVDDDTVAWHENDGSQAFAERAITTLADSAVTVFAIDVDGDGDVDALSASFNDDTVAWYENDGSQAFAERVITGSTWRVQALDLPRKTRPKNFRRTFARHAYAKLVDALEVATAYSERMRHRGDSAEARALIVLALMRRRWFKGTELKIYESQLQADGFFTPPAERKAMTPVSKRAKVIASVLCLVAFAGPLLFLAVFASSVGHKMTRGWYFSTLTTIFIAK